MIDLAVKNVYLRTINLGFLESIRIGIVFDLFVYIFHGSYKTSKQQKDSKLLKTTRFEVLLTKIQNEIRFFTSLR